MHQARTQVGIAAAETVERVVEGIARHLPEVGVPALGSAQPGVLQLLVTPQGGDGLDRVAEHVAACARCRCDVEQSAIGVEHAGGDPGQRAVRHVLLQRGGPPGRSRARSACMTRDTGATNTMGTMGTVGTVGTV